jgi:hypothetical protein
VELYRTNIELYCGHQRNGRQQYEIRQDEYLAGSVIPELYEFYV